LAENGYTLYRRRNNGRTATLSDGTVIDNRNIVPYSPLILLMMESHSNLECCISVKAFKYIHKYVYKGHDRTTMAFGETQNEIQQYLDARYVSASEATWRIFRYSLHEEFPNVVRLAVHLENAQFIIFNEDDTPEDVLANANRNSTLAGFFAVNKKEHDEGIHSASELLYQEMPQKYRWNLRKHQWIICK